MVATTLPSNDFRVIIVGGGISGLVTALAASRFGIRVDLYERNTSIKELGAGVAIGPNAAALLEKLSVGETSRHWEVGYTGKLNTAKRSFYCHRADFVRTIASCLPSDQIHLGKSLKSISQDPHSVTAFFEDGTSVTASALIGADGIRSKVRQTWNQEKPIFSGQIVVRSLVKMAALPQDVQNYCKHGNVWVAPGKKHIVAYPIQRGKTVCAGAIIPAFGARNGKSRGKRGMMRSIWRTLCPPLRSFTRIPRPCFSWAKARRFLGCQGGSQAVEDAYVLGVLLAAASNSHTPGLNITNWFDSRAMGQAFDDLQLSAEGVDFLRKSYSWVFITEALDECEDQMKKSFGPNSVEWENLQKILETSPCREWTEDLSTWVSNPSQQMNI
ncbi:Salicylate hydroxylase 4 [Botrytis cinerea]